MQTLTGLRVWLDGRPDNATTVARRPGAQVSAAGPWAAPATK